MIKIDIMEDASYYNLEALKRVWKDSWVLKSVDIKYDTKGFPEEEKPETWPFKATFMEEQDEIVVRIFSLSVGYCGTGPYDLIAILDWLNVKYHENDIITKRRMDNDGWIRLNYSM